MEFALKKVEVCHYKQINWGRGGDDLIRIVIIFPFFGVLSLFPNSLVVLMILNKRNVIYFRTQKMLLLHTFSNF